MQGKIIFITGGARSGKSSFALKAGSGIKGPKAYIATAEALDDEMRERIEKHKVDRGDDWDTFEVPMQIADTLSEIKEKYGVVLVDCLTLWLLNIMHQKQNTEDEIIKLVDELLNFKNLSHATYLASQLFIVSNEVGMGIVPDNPLAREFRDLAGSLNQKIAALADEVYLVAAGIPIQIKK